MLTSQARESLRGVETVIVDEVHAVAGGKRGAHLAVSLERLDALLDKPAQRVGLSATVRPLDEVARFLGGHAPVDIVAPPAVKAWDLKVVVPVEDMTATDGDAYEADADADDGRTGSIWPHVEEHVVDLVDQHRSTIVFANSRRLAERLTARLNEIATNRAGGDLPETGKPPAQIMAQSGASAGTGSDGVVIAKAHHGSVSKEQRAIIEDDLKRGRLPCVVATSSLELGIDMGAVDLVIQIESPPSVASALQRVGRAGHQVGEVSHGVLFPKHRGDLAQTAVAVERMRAGAIESMRVPPTRSTCWPSRSSPPRPSTPGRSTTSTTRTGEPTLAALPSACSTPPSTCSPDATRQMCLPSCARASTGTGSAARSPPVPAPSGWRSPMPAPSPIGVCSVTLVGEGTGAGSGNSTRRWSTSPGLVTPSSSAPPAGGSRTSATTSGRYPRPGSPAGFLSGRATPSAVPRSRRGHRRLHPRALPRPRRSRRTLARPRPASTPKRRQQPGHLRPRTGLTGRRWNRDLS